MKTCYKCGESDHNIDSCPRYNQIKGIPFALCFICKEKGHLSKNCKDNKNGIFYKGGGCFFCGSNQHKKIDCPKMTNNQSKRHEFDFNEEYQDEEY